MAHIPSQHDYQVAIICALKVEADAVEGIFDELYETKNAFWQKTDGDQITYTVGRIARHHVVLAHMPGMGKINAAITASSIRATFPNTTRGLTLVVGVCGGSPVMRSGDEIYLGDVLISNSIHQADFGRELAHSFIAKDHLEGNLGAAPIEIMSFLGKLQTRTTYATLARKTAEYSSRLLLQADATVPDPFSDNLFPSDYLHKHHISTNTQCHRCASDARDMCEVSQRSTCTQLGCETAQVRIRPPHKRLEAPSIHFGALCSTDAVRRNGVRRDELIQSHNVIGFEMEGAGVWKILPSLVIKSVSDYTDSHKNKKWQDFAAINAAGCCRAVIEEWTSKVQPVPPPTTSLFGGIFAQASNTPMYKGPLDPSAQRQGYLESLDFPQLQARQHDISFAYPRTCDWVFRTQEFKSWLNPDDIYDHHGVLFIRGKPGSGKSVIMKHILHGRHRLKDYTLAAYFFHARGSAIQHSTIGLYRSLLHQLLSSDELLLDKFIAAFPVKAQQDISNRVWSVAELQHFFLLAARQQWIKRIMLFIDALDESDHSEAREIVSFCEDLALNAVRGPSRLLVCLSIRHFPNITVQSCVEVNIDSRKEHVYDIEEYVQNKSRNKALVGDICAKAQHVFLWAVLVVHILNKAYDRGSDLQAIRNQLDVMPPGLDAMFQSILGDSQDAEEDPTLMFQLVFYAFEPLSPSQLYTLATMTDESDSDAFFSESELTDETMWNSILTASRGLLERRLVAGTNNVYFVQFIHETVRDYLGYDSAGREHDAMMDAPSASECHVKIARRCIEVMRIAFASDLVSKYDAEAAGKRFKALTRIEYARKRVLDHIAGARDADMMEELLYAYTDACYVNNEVSVIGDIARHWSDQWSESYYRYAMEPDLSAAEPSLILLVTALGCLSKRWATPYYQRRDDPLSDAIGIYNLRHDMCEVIIKASLKYNWTVSELQAASIRNNNHIVPHANGNIPPTARWHEACGRMH